MGVRVEGGELTCHSTAAPSCRLGSATLCGAIERCRCFLRGLLGGCSVGLLLGGCNGGLRSALGHKRRLLAMANGRSGNFAVVGSGGGIGNAAGSNAGAVGRLGVGQHGGRASVGCIGGNGKAIGDVSGHPHIGDCRLLGRAGRARVDLPILGLVLVEAIAPVPTYLAELRIRHHDLATGTDPVVSSEGVVQDLADHDRDPLRDLRSPEIQFTNGGVLLGEGQKRPAARLRDGIPGEVQVDVAVSMGWPQQEVHQVKNRLVSKAVTGGIQARPICVAVQQRQQSNEALLSEVRLVQRDPGGTENRRRIAIEAIRHEVIDV
mmetsp:Transcript_23926/g.77070  ORF Transcript_23926/g.77070 Transcript_23926/m.77070 type:complete len:320 (-) Transcript_23926:499-1458(-)